MVLTKLLLIQIYCSPGLALGRERGGFGELSSTDDFYLFTNIMYKMGRLRTIMLYIKTRRK